MEQDLIKYVKTMRKQHNLTQVECARKAGVGLMFLRDLEQGKESLRMDKVNQVLQLFGAKLGVVRLK
jgi:y4mF family transcriptional regulator